MSNDNKTYEGMPPIEELAARTTDEAFERNAKFWAKTHERQYRLYENVRNFPRKVSKQKSDSYNRKGFIATTKSKRSNIQLGLMWALHNVGMTVAKKSILEGEELVELLPRPGVDDLLFLDEMSDYIEDLFTDDIPDIKGAARDALWDIFTCCGVLCPSWKKVLKNIRLKKGDNYEEVEVDLGSYPIYTHYSPWDTYPTAGIIKPKDAHEWILCEKITIAELRELERKGEIDNLDKVIESLKKNDKVKSKEGNSRRDKTGFEGEIDDSTQIEILINYTYFPLYNYEKYIDDDGKDRSKDEVECVIIKAKHADPIMFLDRNPHACQEKPIILAGWYIIPGELYPISAFEIAEKLIISHENSYNLIQDGPNGQIYPTEIIPKDAIDSAELGNPDAPGRRLHVDSDLLKAGVKPEYMVPPNSILVDMYGQRDYSYQMIQTVTTINDWVQGMMPTKQVKATEIMEVSQRIQTLFHQAAIDIEASLMKPLWEWMIVLLAENSDDRQIAKEMGLVYQPGDPNLAKVPDAIMGEDGLFYYNPFKQFVPVMPNPKFKLKLNGALRAAESQQNQLILQNMIELGKEMPPMPDVDGQLIVPNIERMYFDLMKMSALRDTEKYKLIVPGPEEMPVTGGADNVASV